MDRTLQAIRRRIPQWARKCVPPSLKRLLTPPVNAPVLGLDEHLPPGLPRRERKRALVSYITLPFRLEPCDPRNVQFSNVGIARDMVQSLNELGYIVDVVDYLDTTFKVQRRYDLFLGHGGRNVPGLISSLPVEAVRIYFASGIYTQEMNRLEKERFDALERRRGVRLPYERWVTESEEEACRRSDAILCLGNQRVQASFSSFAPVLNINNAAYPVAACNLDRKDFAYACKRFLFFAGEGNVHKGLDLLLEAFTGLEAELYICQRISPEFGRTYRRELQEAQNIHSVGWIEMRWPEFYRLAGNCAFVIHPSCAEGQPGGVIECMHHGLIPVVSRECNLDAEGFGVTLDRNTVEEIGCVVRALSLRPAAWCREMAGRTLQAARSEYSEAAFLANMRAAVREIVARAGKTRVKEDASVGR